MDDASLKLAQKRIWRRLEKRLPDRGISTYQPLLRGLRQAAPSLEVSRLKQVQLKERLLEVLPDPCDVKLWPSFFTPRFWSVPALGVLLSVVLFSGVRLAPPALAASESMVRPIEGDVFLNGIRIEEDVVIQAGDQLSTGEGAFAHVTFLDDSRLTLGPSSGVEIVRLDHAPENVTATQVELRQISGQLWSQVLNLVSKGAFLTLHVGDLTATVTQSASFDSRITDEGAELRVASHWLNVSSENEQWDYQTVLSQEEALEWGDGIQKRALTEAEQGEVWWVFNAAYGQSYARQLDASYEKAHIARATILPGSPFYPLKTFREKIQFTLTWGDEAKQDLLVEQAQTRLSEAKVLLASGQEDEAKEILEVYEETVDEMIAADGSAQLEALVDQAQKEAVAAVIAKTDAGTRDTLIEDSLESTVQVLAEVHSETAGLSVQPLPHLTLAPDFLEQQRFDDLALALQDYESQMEVFEAYFTDLTAEEKALIANQVLDQNLAELQDLRVLIGEDVDLDVLTEDQRKKLLELQNLAVRLRDEKIGMISQLTVASSHFALEEIEGAPANASLDGGDLADVAAAASGDSIFAGDLNGQAGEDSAVSVGQENPAGALPAETPAPEVLDPRFE